MSDWKHCRKILCIRADNMGDVIMSGPALRALKTSFSCSITLLTSSMGSIITPMMPEIDETIIYNLPWIKSNEVVDADKCVELIALLKSYSFDAAIIFTVYSQNPLPTALVTYMAGIPLRLAYCRENPYGLLTDWVPDKEPYSFIRHQVERDLALVKRIGVVTDNDLLQLQIPQSAAVNAAKKIAELNIISGSYIIIHPGVSEAKRRYPVSMWIQALRKVYESSGLQMLITGTTNEAIMAGEIHEACKSFTTVTCGLFSMEEFTAAIAYAALVISVNTGTVHIASAVQTPVVVLYAQTNPQHTPWKTNSTVLPFMVDRDLQSKNEVIRYVHNKLYAVAQPYPTADMVAQAAAGLLQNRLKVVT